MQNTLLESFALFMVACGVFVGILFAHDWLWEYRRQAYVLACIERETTASAPSYTELLDACREIVNRGNK